MIISGVNNFISILFIVTIIIALLVVLFAMVCGILSFKWDYEFYIKNDKENKKIYKDTMYKNANVKDYALLELDLIDNNNFEAKRILEDILKILD